MKNIYPIILVLLVFVVMFRKSHNGDSHEENND